MPGLVAIRSSTVSDPLGPKPSGCGSSETSSAAPSIASSASSPATCLPSLRAARRLVSGQLARELRTLGVPGGQAAVELLGAIVHVLEPIDLGPASFRVRQHGLDRPTVLSLQAIELAEPLLDLLDARGLGIDSVEVGPKRTRDVVQLHGGRADSLAQLIQ